MEETKTKPISEKGPAKIVNIVMISQSGRYRIGSESRPDIKHDSGFLDKFSHEEPTIGDRVQLQAWRAKLELAESLRPDLADATAAYKHFLDGKGSERSLNYERYIKNDESGKTTLASIIDDFKYHAGIIGEDREYFELTSDSYAAGRGSLFPYPKTENWQKAIGAHILWVSAKIHCHIDSVDMKNSFSADVTIHMEDRYNFNPGAQDIATGIPDSANGRFEVTGLAMQYMNYGVIHRHVEWKEGNGSAATVSGESQSRQRRPSDNRRLRNKI